MSIFFFSDFKNLHKHLKIPMKSRRIEKDQLLIKNSKVKISLGKAKR